MTRGPADHTDEGKRKRPAARRAGLGSEQSSDREAADRAGESGASNGESADHERAVNVPSEPQGSGRKASGRKSVSARKAAVQAVQKLGRRVAARASLADKGAEQLSAPQSVGGTAPALRGGASVAETAPALRGGASVTETAPALRGGASVTETAPALRGGASVTETAPALRGGASVTETAPALRGGASVTETAPALRGGASQLDATGGPAVHDMERDLAGLLSDIDGAEGNAEARRRAADAIGRIAARLYPDAPASSAEEDRLLVSARQLLSTDYYLKQWGRFGMRGRSEQVDDFGFDPAYEARVQPLLDFLYERYFRVRIEGVEHIPEHGAALLVCNRAGTLPWDGVMLKTALRHARPERCALRWLTDDFVFHSPFLGPILSRIGAARACPENAERLLARDELLAVFPEGIKGIGKPFRERYQLQRFGRGGHIKLALRARVPVIPLAIVGSEESYPLIYKLRAFSKLLGLPFIPVTPLFPWLGPLGLLPLPSRWHIVVGEPMHEFDGLEPRAAEDTVLVNDLNEQLRGKVQLLLQDALRARGPSAFF